MVKQVTFHLYYFLVTEQASGHPQGSITVVTAQVACGYSVYTSQIIAVTIR